MNVLVIGRVEATIVIWSAKLSIGAGKSIEAICLIFVVWADWIVFVGGVGICVELTDIIVDIVVCELTIWADIVWS